MKRKSYDDKFRASAVVMLEAAGYPNEKGALTKTAAHIGVPARTLSRWFNGEQNPPPDQTVNEKRDELSVLLDTEIRAILGDMPEARKDASYRDLGTVAGILIDKIQLITGKPTSRSETTGKDGGPIETRTTILSTLSDDELNAIIAGDPSAGFRRKSAPGDQEQPDQV